MAVNLYYDAFKILRMILYKNKMRENSISGAFILFYFIYFLFFFFFAKVMTMEIANSEGKIEEN